VNWDESLFRAINGLAGQSTVLDWLALMFSSPGTLWIPGILLACYWLWLSWREAVIGAPFLGGATVLLDFIGAQLKHLVARPRPCSVLPDVHQLVGCGKALGFPSNHAVNTATAAAFLHVLYPRSGWISWPLVALVGLSRVYIGAHYVTDVLGGWVLGGLCGAGVAWFLLQWPRFRDRSVITACKVPRGADTSS
jgi:membrane-associated phospholipid phosphatase